MGPKLAFVVLIAGAVLQLYSLTTSYLLPWGKSILSVRDLPPWERSALLYPFISEDQTAIIGQLRQRTPESSTLVFTDSHPPFSWRPMLQYFLFPRGIEICEVSQIDRCVENGLDREVIIVQFPGFPKLHAAPQGYAFEPLTPDREYGVFIPSEGLK
jgi:hypothetical protein